MAKNNLGATSAGEVECNEKPRVADEGVGTAFPRRPMPNHISKPEQDLVGAIAEPVLGLDAEGTITLMR